MAVRRGKVSAVFSGLLAAAVTGVVVAAIALPAGLVLGLAADTTHKTFRDLPEVLKNPPLPQKTTVYAADGTTQITSFYDQNRRELALDQIPVTMRQAVLAAEDSRFYQHGGVDPVGMARAFVNNNNGGSKQGGSTLTMQYIRQTLAYTATSDEARRAATDPTYSRKVAEVGYAAALEKQLPKDEILRRYLNTVYFGQGAYGVAAASRAYFSKDAKDLTLGEAATLAALVQSPNEYDPVANDPKAATDRRDWVLGRMAELKYVTAAQADEARAKPLKTTPTSTPGACVGAGTDLGFFCDYFRQWWLANPAFGKTPAEREQLLVRGGYTVVTSLDPKVQAAARNAVAEQVDVRNPLAMNVAVVEPGTGRVKALSVNRNYSTDQSGNGVNTAGTGGKGGYPNTVAPLVTGGPGVTGYQAGSTFKMFTMLAALEAGKTLDTTFDAPSKFTSKYPDRGRASCGGYWCPVNASPSWMDGKRTMWDAFGRSVNTYFVWLEQQIGAEKAVEMARRLGIQFRAPNDQHLADNAASWGAFTLGVADTTPLDLATAYATVAAEGVYCAPTPVQKIVAPDGTELDAGKPQCKRVLSPDVARAATDAARRPVGDRSALMGAGAGTADNIRGIVGRPVAGKTGTTDNTHSATFAGYTPQLAVAGIVADPDNPNRTVDGYDKKVNLAVARTLRDASAGLPARDFNAPSAKIAYADGKHPPSEPTPTPTPR